MPKNEKTRKQIKEEMIIRAKEKYGEITPCSGHKDFTACFTVEQNIIMFWFNDKTKSTRMIFTKEYPK